MTAATGRVRFGLLATLAAVFAVGLASTAQAATYTVTTAADEQPAIAADCPPDASADGCSLREAVYAASNNPGADVIVIPAGDYVLTNELDDPDGEADLDITALDTGGNTAAGGLTIIGAGARTTTIRSQGEVSGSLVFSRIFEIEGGDSFDPGGGCVDFPGPVVELRGLTLTDGVETSDEGGAISIEDGDANCAFDDVDASDAHVTVIDSAITNNTANDEGGGIANRGELTLINSLVAGNSSNFTGGGIDSGDTLNLTNVTVAGNQSDSNGGGIRASAFDLEEVGNGGDEQTGLVGATNVTLVHNEAGGSGGGFSGSGFFGPGPSFLEARNTIIAHNDAGEEGNNCYRPANVTSLGNNIEDRDTCGFNGSSDRSSTDPLLGSRSDNGGPTNTYALLAGSPAIDGGTNDGCPSTDQRGIARPQGARCDVGAFEFVPPATTTPPAGGTQIVTVTVPTAFERVAPNRVTARVRKTRPRRGAVRLRTRGRVVPPAGMTREQACTFGVLTVQVKSGKRTVSSRVTQLRRDCTYRSGVTFTVPRRLANRKMRVVVRWRGNDRLTARRARVVNVGRP